MSDTNTVTISQLRPMLQHFNEELGQYINAEERYKLGQVLTVIDASIADPEQRKAIKDLVNGVWWGGGGYAARPSDTKMGNPHSDIRALCKVLGFELYDDSSSLQALPVDDTTWIEKRYKDVLKTR